MLMLSNTYIMFTMLASYSSGPRDRDLQKSTTTFSESGKMTPLKLGTGIKVGVPDFNSIGLHQKQMALLVPDFGLCVAFF